MNELEHISKTFSNNDNNVNRIIINNVNNVNKYTIKDFVPKNQYQAKALEVAEFLKDLQNLKCYLMLVNKIGINGMDRCLAIIKEQPSVIIKNRGAYFVGITKKLYPNKWYN